MAFRFMHQKKKKTLESNPYLDPKFRVPYHDVRTLFPIFMSNPYQIKVFVTYTLNLLIR